MKVLAFYLFVVASVSARGSGPYLPSGWRPAGPAFYLPSEVQKPAENPLRDVVLDGSEASGTEALREYGPPKTQEVPQGVTNQGLPDVAIEQNFFVTAPESLDAVARLIVDEQAVENIVKSEEAVTVQLLEAFTKSQSVEEQSVVTVNSIDETRTIVEEISPRDFSNLEAIIVAEEVTEVAVTVPTVSSIAEIALGENLNDQTTVTYEEIATTVNIAEQDSTLTSQQESVANNVEQSIVLSEQQLSTDSIINAEVTLSQLRNIDANTETVEQVVEIEEKKLEEIVQNIPEIIANLDSEVQSNQVVQVSAVQENTGSLEQVPEGFLEYGPPGFSEYGPPKVDQLARDGKSLDLETVNNNETRRRRFSPKFKSTRKAH